MCFVELSTSSKNSSGASQLVPLRRGSARGGTACILGKHIEIFRGRVDAHKDVWNRRLMSNHIKEARQICRTIVRTQTSSDNLPMTCLFSTKRRLCGTHQSGADMFWIPLQRLQAALVRQKLDTSQFSAQDSIFWEKWASLKQRKHVIWYGNTTKLGQNLRHWEKSLLPLGSQRSPDWSRAQQVMLLLLSSLGNFSDLLWTTSVSSQVSWIRWIQNLCFSRWEFFFLIPILTPSFLEQTKIIQNISFSWEIRQAKCKCHARRRPRRCCGSLGFDEDTAWHEAPHQSYESIDTAITATAEAPCTLCRCTKS